MYDEKFMKRAMQLAFDAASCDEVPVGAVIVLNGEIIGESGNRKERDMSATRHAEMVALEIAAKKTGNWWLEGAEAYVTLEPCPMCAYAFLLSRVKAVYFGAYDVKAGGCGSKINIFEKGKFNHDVEYQGGYMQEECARLLSEFFAEKRAGKSRLKQS